MRRRRGTICWCWPGYTGPRSTTWECTASPRSRAGGEYRFWIPISPGPSFSETRAWTEKLSRVIGAVVPNLLSWKWQVSERSGLARLDYTQNAINKTLVAPYSPRPAPGAPVSAPIEWHELDDPALAPDAFTIRTILARIAEKGDLFLPVLARDQRLPAIS